MQIPAINEQYDYPTGPKGNFKKDTVAAINKLRSLYGSGVANASRLSGVPQPIIIGFSVVENNTVNPNTVSGGGAVGLMQIQPESGAYILSIQKGLTAEHIAFIKKYLPNALNPDGTVKSESALKPMFTESLMKKPDWNLFIGSLMLGSYLLESQKKYGQFRFDHAIIKYNAGIGNFATYVDKKGLATSDTTTIKNAFPKVETKAYLVKMLGVNGSLDILKQMGLT